MPTLNSVKLYLGDTLISGEGDGSYNEGYADGQQAEYDRFWDAYQQNGNRTNYKYSFARWTDETFKPKYPIKVEDGNYMFYGLDVKNLVLDGVVDFSYVAGWRNLQWTFAEVNCETIDLIDISNVPSAAALGGFIYYPYKLHTIGKIKLRADGTANIRPDTFVCAELVNVTFEGVIGANMDVKASTKLSKASITSIINALSSSASGLTLTLSKTAKEAAFTADEWSTLIATKSNWTISLA